MPLWKIPRPSLCSKQNFLRSTEGNQERKADQEWSPYRFWHVHSWCKNHSSPGDGPSTALPLLQITEIGLFYMHSLINIIVLRLRTAHCPFATASYQDRSVLQPQRQSGSNTTRVIPGKTRLKFVPSIKLPTAAKQLLPIVNVAALISQ